MKKYRAILALVLITSLIASTMARSARALEIAITENGSGSSNEAVVNNSTETTVVQTNNAEVSNDINIDANTGGNSASDNGGEVEINTGDVNVNTAVSNSVNYSITTITTCCPDEGVNVSISGNGANSTNTTNLSQASLNAVIISQNAQIYNETIGYASTGENEAKGNMGDVTINTGNIKVTDIITNGPINIASVRVAGGTASDVSVKIKDNGSDSQNTVGAEIVNEEEVLIDHNAEFINVSDWYLETGDNEAKDNLGDVEIKTGDIEFETFIKNFANIGGVDISTCCEVEAKPNDDPDEGEKTPLPGGGGGGGVNGDSSSSGGSILPSAAATEAGGPGIMGLSDTSSESAKALFFWMSLGFIAFGGKIVTEELLPKTSRKKR